MGSKARAERNFSQQPTRSLLNRTYTYPGNNPLPARETLTIFWSGVSPDGVELDEDVGDGAEEVAQHHHHRQLHRLDLGVRNRPANRERISKRKTIVLRIKLRLSKGEKN